MPKQKLLIVDDSDDIHELVQVWLTGQPVEFHSCHDGQEALKTAPTLRPDLILLDVDLPGLDGFEVCKRLKADPVTWDIPIVFLTGASATEEKLRGLEMGATDYVTKPFDPAELRARVRSSLHTKNLIDLLAQKEERFRILAENSSDVISRHSPDGAYLYVSPASIAILGYTPEQLQGHPVTDFTHPDDVPTIIASSFSTRIGAQTGTVEFRFRRADGEFIWLESTWRSIADGTTGVVREIHASARDITRRKQMENREQIRAEILEMIAQGRALHDILCRLIDGAQQQEPQIVAAAVALTAGRNQHVSPRLPEALTAGIEERMPAIIGRFEELSAGKGDRIAVCDLQDDPQWKELAPLMAEHGIRSCWSILIGARQRGPAGAFCLYLRDSQRPGSSAIDMMKLASELTGVAIEHRQLTEQLTFQAHHDALTQLPNRVLFGDRLEQAVALAARTSQPAAVLLIDVDRFKYINDTYGHHAGDEMLCQVGKRLRLRLRAADTLARMGGDEFAVILSHLSKPEDAELVAKALVDEFKQPIDLRGRILPMTVTVGSAVCPMDGTDPISLLKCADLALYRAKESGRNMAIKFAPEMGDGIVARMEMENALRQAITNGELRLHYQPKVDIAGTIIGVEALVRWQHPTQGLIPPVKFIPLAEDTGLILPIGAWVLLEAARQHRAWIDGGLPSMNIAVNVSTMQFAQADFLQTVDAALVAAGDPASWLEIELTESLLMKNMRDAVEKLSLLRQKKVSVGIDDFGTGYSSLAYLQRLSLDTLKINQSFFEGFDPGAGGVGNSGRTITGAIVALAKSLGLHVVAEGVETEAQRGFLTRVGCHIMQGYLFSPALTSEELDPILRNRTRLPAIPIAQSA